MTSFRRIYQLNKCLVGYYKNVLHGRPNGVTIFQLQTSEYTRKSTEEKLGIEKPKRPLNPFFKFMVQMRPVLHAKIPGISAKDATLWCSKHWQQLDYESKSKMIKEYQIDFETYRKKKEIYDASLTKEQKEHIKRVNGEMTATREKRKLKWELKKMGMPKKPMSSYLLYAQLRKDLFQSTQLKQYQEKIKTGWLNLTESERVEFDKQAKDLMKKYKKDMEAWELKMISMGHLHLVSQKPERKAKKKNIERS